MFLTGDFQANIGGASPEGKPIFSLELRYYVLYELKEKADWPKDEVDHFASSSMMMHVWPYIRELVDQLTRRSPIVPVVLPLMPIEPKIVTAQECQDG